MEKTSFGLIKYTSFNIGDEIQSLAASRFLPNIDYYINRERTDKFKSDQEEKVKVIMNAWWMWQSKHFPPSEDIDPLLISMHIQNGVRDSFFKNKAVKDYLIKYGPVGCRDKSTVDYFKSHGVDAYFSGCLTSTLLPNNNLKHKIISDYVLCVDVPKNIEVLIQKKSKLPVYNLSRFMTNALVSKGRFELAKYMLFIYHNASCVFTPCLHVGMPCLAFDTPVVLLKDKTMKDGNRFDGLDDYFNTADVSEFEQFLNDYDIDNPVENSKAFLKMRENLVNRCKSFTGFDSEKSIFEDSYNPILSLAEFLAYSKENEEKMLLCCTRTSLIKATLKRIILGIDKFGFDYDS